MNYSMRRLLAAWPWFVVAGVSVVVTLAVMLPAVLIAANGWLTPGRGLWGSAVATVITAAVQIITGLFILAHLLRSMKRKPLLEII